MTWLLAPVVAAGSLLTSGDWGGPTLAACGFAGAATAISFVLRDRRIARCLRGVILMSQISLLVANGGEWQIDLHMAYFAALAMLVICADWLVILVAALTVAVHHLVLTYILPPLCSALPRA